MKREVRYIKGRKWYQLRDSKGCFAGCQLFKRAHGQDIKRKSKAEKRKNK
jgi:hypothetical protein